MGGEDSCSSPPIITAVLLSLIVASGLIGCGPIAPNANRDTATRVTEPNCDTATRVAEPNRRAETQVADHATTPSEQASTYLVLRLKERRLELMRDDGPAPIASFPIAIGRTGHETPTGRFLELHCAVFRQRRGSRRERFEVGRALAHRATLSAGSRPVGTTAGSLTRSTTPTASRTASR